MLRFHLKQSGQKASLVRAKSAVLREFAELQAFSMRSLIISEKCIAC